MTGEDKEVSESFLLALKGSDWMTEDVFELSWPFMGCKLDGADCSCWTVECTDADLLAGFVEWISARKLYIRRRLEEKRRAEKASPHTFYPQAKPQVLPDFTFTFTGPTITVLFSSLTHTTLRLQVLYLSITPQ
jgi:hypothetical protein